MILLAICERGANGRFTFGSNNMREQKDKPTGWVHFVSFRVFSEKFKHNSGRQAGTRGHTRAGIELDGHTASNSRKRRLLRYCTVIRSLDMTGRLVIAAVQHLQIVAAGYPITSNRRLSSLIITQDTTRKAAGRPLQKPQGKTPSYWTHGLLKY